MRWSLFMRVEDMILFVVLILLGQ